MTRPANWPIPHSNPNSMQNERPVIIAWVGEDEFGSGQVGIKRGFYGNGQPFVMALTEEQDGLLKLSDPNIRDGLQGMVNHYGKPVRLMRFEAVEELLVITPTRHG